MPQQYLPPALMLEQLRNERYRQAAQGIQQGLGQSLQALMTMEQLKQAAAEKKAERDERARQFNESQRMRQAELESLQALREGRLGLQQQQQTLAEKKAADAQAAVADAQDLAQLNLTAFGVDPKQRAVAGADTQTAAEFMRKGLKDFGQQRQAATPKPTYEPVSREEILGLAPKKEIDQPSQVERISTPMSARQVFEALPAGEDELGKTTRLMNALAAGEFAGARRGFPIQDVQPATISPDAAKDFERLAATEKQATGQTRQLFSNLDALLEAQQRRPQDFAVAERYRDAGGKRAFGEISGAAQAQELAKQEKLLGLDKLKAETGALQALKAQRAAAARGAGRGRVGAGGGKAQRPYMQEAALDYVEVNKRAAQEQKGKLQLALTDAQKLLRDLRNPKTEFGMEPAIDEAGIKEVQQRIAALNDQIKEYDKTIGNYDVQANQILAGKIDPFTIEQAQAAQPAGPAAFEQSVMTEEQLAAIQAQRPVDPAQAAADASKQRRIKEIQTQMATLAPQVTAGPGSEAAVKMNKLAAELDKLRGIFRPDPGVAEAYRREAREAVAQKVALSPQDAERLIASAPLATQRKLKAEAAKMQNAGMSREEIAAVLGLRRAEMIPLSRGRF